MLTYLPAAPEQYDDFFRLMAAESRDYLDTTLLLMGADRDEFARLFRTVGQVYGIYEKERAVTCVLFYLWYNPAEPILAGEAV